MNFHGNAAVAPLIEQHGPLPAGALFSRFKFNQSPLNLKLDAPRPKR
jgi:hypothetical protein